MISFAVAQRALPALTVILVLAFCSPQAARLARAEETIAPEQAVMRAAAVPHFGVEGDFEYTVAADGLVGGVLYLNSEKDYRDPRCLTVDLTPAVQARLGKDFGTATLQGYFIGKRIIVHGTARRTPIYVFDERGHRTGQYYFQTHIRVTRSWQIKVR